jgi:hypothetical protein
MKKIKTSIQNKKASNFNFHVHLSQNHAAQGQKRGSAGSPE